MADLNQPSENHDAAPAAPLSRPAETPVAPSAAAEGAKREGLAERAKLSAEIQNAQLTDAQVTAAAAAAGVPSDAIPPVPDDKSKVSGAWGMVGGLGDFFTKISDTFSDIGKKFSEWLKALMESNGPKESKASTEPAPDLKPTDKASHAPERIAEDSEMLTPNAPIFSFAKTFDGTPHASDVPRVRPVHPVTGKHNVPHEGVDIPAPIGTPIFATHAMTMLDPKLGHVKCRLEDGRVAEFFHVTNVAAFKAGDPIPKGARIADVGNEGISTGPHLHFQMDQGDTDPIPYLDPGLIDSAEEKIDEKKKKGEWIPLESDATEHGIV